MHTTRTATRPRPQRWAAFWAAAARFASRLGRVSRRDVLVGVAASFVALCVYGNQPNLAALGVALMAFACALGARKDAADFARARRDQSNAESALATAMAALRRRDHECTLLQCILSAPISYSVIATDNDGLITHFSDGAAHLLGYTAEQMVGKRNVLSLHDAHDLAERAQVLGVTDPFDVFRVLPNLNLCDERDWTYVCRDGRRVSMRLSVTRLYNSQNETLGYVGIARDRTEDHDLQRDRDGFFSVGQELLCIGDTGGSIHTINPAFYRVLGYRPQDVMGRRYLAYIHPEDRNNLDGVLTRIDGGAAINRFENRWRAKDGSWHWIAWDTTVPNSDGKYYASGWDITQEKMRSKERERLLLFEQHLIGIVSHDLRNPIAAISLSAEHFLRTNAATELAANRQVQRIAQCAHRAERMIHDLLDFTQARLGAGIVITPHHVPILRLLRRCVDDMRVAYPGRTIDLQAPRRQYVWADTDRLGQLITNLLGNALKYSPIESIVGVSATSAGSNFIIEVHNAGEPIEAARLPHIFEPMSRGNQEGYAQRNVGLGLYIVKAIATAHGGHVQVTSTAEAGTTFRVELPDIPTSK